VRRLARWTLAPWLVVGALWAAKAPAQVLDAIVARVDQGVVTWSEVLQERELLRLEGAPTSLLEWGAVTEALIRRRLLVAEAEKLRLEVDDGAVGKEARALTGLDGGAVLPSLRRVGLDRPALERRAHERALMDQYLGLRREMTFIPEAEIRKAYLGQAGRQEQASLSEAYDQLRAQLAERVFQQELDQWIDRQVKEGRVVRNASPQP